jgi:DNA-binding NarL/FixJ family response regulator
MKPPIRVAIVEDKAALRQQYERLLNEAPGFECCAAFGDAESALAGIAQAAPDVVLMDIQLPKMSGVECVPGLKAALPKVNIIMLTAYDDADLIFRALENGAGGYLLKRTPPDELLRAIEDVHRGGAPMSSHIARMVVQSFQRRGASPSAAENLSPREEDVLRLVAKGLVNKEIADQLSISTETVRGYLKSIYTKLHVRSRTEAAMKVFGENPSRS